MKPVIYAADVGSIAQGNFGWARIDTEMCDTQIAHDTCAAEIVQLVDAVADDLAQSRPVALGFESPLFVPVPPDARELGKAREGEGTHPFSAGAGTGALVIGLVESAWVLRALRDRCPDATAFLGWHDFVAAGRGLFLWEAFVSGGGKGTSHVDDARIAADAFRRALPNPWDANAIAARAPLSLIGTVLLWSGWSQDAELLHQPCLVIKASPAAAPQPTSTKAAPAPPPKLTAPIKGSLHAWVVRVAEQIPEGRWTTYGRVARIITDAVETPLRPVAIGIGNELKNDPYIPNAHRILREAGKLADLFPFPLERLTGEGVRFLNGRADPTQRWPDPGP